MEGMGGHYAERAWGEHCNCDVLPPTHCSYYLYHLRTKYLEKKLENKDSRNTRNLKRTDNRAIHTP